MRIYCCRIGNFLDYVDLGEYVVSGQLEVYSCKRPWPLHETAITGCR